MSETASSLLSTLGGAALSVLQAAGPAGAAPASCVVQPPPKVEVVSRAPRVEVDNTLDAAGLVALQRRSGGGEIKAGAQLQGFALSSLAHSVEWRRKTWQVADGTWCAALVEATVTIQYVDPLRVYVRSDYRPGSCAYGVVLDHEMTHARFSQQTLERHLPYLRAGFPASLQPLTAVTGRTEEEAGERIRLAMGDVIAQAARNVSLEADGLHATIDTDENYRRENGRCPRW